jgi:serine/threonine protein kinase
VIGAPHYIAPEILRIKFGHSFEADIWSLGVSLYIMLTGKPPFAGADERTIHKAV